MEWTVQGMVLQRLEILIRRGVDGKTWIELCV